MKPRSIFIILSLLVCLSTLVGGYIYLSSLNQTILNRSEHDSTRWTKYIHSEVTTQFGKQRDVVAAIAGLKALTGGLSMVMIPSSPVRVRLTVPPTRASLVRHDE